MNRQATGFTLVELMVTLAVAAILLSIAVPSFSSFIQNNRITSATNHLVAHLQYARSEAVSKGLAVNLARNTTSTAKDLSKGWTIYTDAGSTNGNTAYNASEDTLLKSFEGYGSSNITINTNSDGNNWIAFSSRGLLAEGAGKSIVIAVCDDRGVTQGRLITISPTGRSRVTDSTDATTPLTTCTPT
ncbi:GspH/FimT family pseudopilin [Alkalimarinus coralli]|uniref:GspH/FimT family pseudopilin n=1 Tax=Alkalimarinus coralli TaxID=2935863 RepID=UPI00202B48F1|nr:GspH/FimT family pseudopilin [Alkalimarinus coralli]